MTIRFLGKDPESPNNGSPTLYESETGFLVQGWVVSDPGVLAELGAVPTGEAVVEIPRRMLQFFPGVSGGNDELLP
jgi:hypothetical protein